MDQAEVDRLRKQWGEWVRGDMGREDKDDESFEYMRRKLWADVVMKLIGTSDFDVVDIADAVMRNFDQRFGKGEGE